MGYGWIEIVGVFSGIVGLSVSIPQLVKVLKANSHVGVSAISWTLMMLNYASWFGFSVRMASPSQLVANLIAVVVTSILVFVLLKENWGSVVLPLGFILLTVLFSVGFVLLSPEILMDVFLTLFILARLPQVMSSFKSWRIARHTNVSLTSYALMVVSSLGWATYGLVAGLWMNVFSSSMGLLLSLLIVCFEVGAERKYKQSIQF